MNKITKKSEGMTFFDVLVALLVLSVGLLAIAALQTKGQRFNHDALIRTQATMLAYDIMDRIRINRTFATTGMGYIVSTNPESEDDCDKDSCIPGQLRDYDLTMWYNHLRAYLPDGNGQIISNNPNEYNISISWTVRNNSEDEDTENTKKALGWVLRL